MFKNAQEQKLLPKKPKYQNGSSRNMKKIHCSSDFKCIPRKRNIQDRFWQNKETKYLVNNHKRRCYPHIQESWRGSLILKTILPKITCQNISKTLLKSQSLQFAQKLGKNFKKQTSERKMNLLCFQGGLYSINFLYILQITEILQFSQQNKTFQEKIDKLNISGIEKILNSVVNTNKKSSKIIKNRVLSCNQQTLSTTIMEMLNSLLIRQQKMEHSMQFTNNKLDELLDRQFTNDKVIHRLEVKLDKLMGKSGMGGAGSMYGVAEGPYQSRNDKGSQNKYGRKSSEYYGQQQQGISRNEKELRKTEDFENTKMRSSSHLDNLQKFSDYSDSVTPGIQPNINNNNGLKRVQSQRSGIGSQQQPSLFSSSKNSQLNNPIQTQLQKPSQLNSAHSSQYRANGPISRQSSHSQHSNISNHKNTFNQIQRNSSQNSNNRKGILLTSPPSGENDQSRRTDRSPSRIFGIGNKSKEHSGTQNMLDFSGNDDYQQNSGRKKSRSIPKDLFDSKLMIKPHEGNVSANQFFYNHDQNIVTARFTGWYQLLMDKTVNMAKGTKCYFEVRVLKSRQFNIMVGICALDRVKCTTSYSSGKAIALNLWNFHIYSKAGAEKMQGFKLDKGSLVKVEVEAEIISWFLNGQFVARSVIPPQLRLCTLVGYIEIYDKQDSIKLN